MRFGVYIRHSLTWYIIANSYESHGMRYIFILLALLSVSCSSTLPSFKPYHLDIQQGNVISSKMMLQLKPGMTKSQVRYVLGTPLLQDSFHQNRWDYIYQMSKGDTVVERRRVILEFENDGLKTVRGDIIPAGSPGAEQAPIASVADLKTVKSDKTLLAEDPKTTWYDRLKFWNDDKDKVAKSAESSPVKAEEAKVAAEQPKKGWMDKLKFWESDAPPAKELEQAKEVAKAQSAQVAKQIEPVKAAEAEAPKAVEPAAVSEPAPLVEQAAAPAETAAEVKAAVQDVAKEVASEVVSPEPATVAETKQVPESYDASVAKMVDAWANAWRTKNVNAYLNFYADSFKPEGMSKKAWVEQRKQRVGGKSAAISLVLDNISIKADAKKANVTFVQQYSSGNFSDKVAKALSLERANGQWLIVRESVASASTQPSSQPVVDGAEYVKPRDVTADEKSEAMPEKMLQESAKQAQRAQPQQVPQKVQPQKPQPEAKAVEAKPVDAKAAPIKPESAPVKAEVAKPAAPVDKKDLPLPPEDSSGYFERLLEKIGF